MNEIVLIDLITITAAFAGIVGVIIRKRKKLGRSFKVLTLFIFALTIIYNFFMIVEWSNISNAFEPYENLAGALFPMIWAFLFYALMQKVDQYDLKANEKHLEMALKGSRAGVWDWGVKTGQLIINKRWAEIIGYQIDELKPISVETWIKHIHPEDFEKSGELIRKHFSGELEYYECETRMKHKNGDFIWVADRGIVIERDDNNKPVRMIGTHIEINRQKQLEEELREKIKENQIVTNKYLVSNEELLESIEEIKTINQELTVAKKRAEESDRLKSSFLANMSHEIRTPMNGILGFAELLESPKLDDNKRMEFINIIQQSGKRMLNIINDLIDVSKIESGIIDLHYSEFNINEFLKDTFLFYLPEAEKKGLSLNFSLCNLNQETIIKTDFRKLNQILSNLINNAIKYTNSGAVIFGCNTVDNNLEFFVEDTGIGIPFEMQDKIFERFRQINLNPAKAKDGSGLGLTITKAYVEKLGGKIWLESELGRGSIFYFSIPASEKSNHKYKKIEKKYMGMDYSDLTVLVAEDDDISFLFLYELLTEKDFKVMKAVNGKEAVEICKDYPEISLVLMDIKMPEMNGYEAVREIKKIRPDLPVIAQTAYALAGEVDNILKSGCDNYIAKPIQEEELFGVIAKTLSKNIL